MEEGEGGEEGEQRKRGARREEGGDINSHCYQLNNN